MMFTVNEKTRGQGTWQSVCWITLVAGLLWLSACSPPVSDEVRLRQAMTEIEQATEARTVRPILDYLAEDFRGNGQYRKANINGLLLMYFRQNPHIHVYIHVGELTLHDSLAEVRCQVILAGRDQSIVPERGRILEIDSEWQKRNGEWKVVRATWQDSFR